MVAEAVVLVTANLAVLVVTLSALCLLLTSRRWVFPSVVVAVEPGISTEVVMVDPHPSVLICLRVVVTVLLVTTLTLVVSADKVLAVSMSSRVSSRRQGVVCGQAPAAGGSLSFFAGLKSAYIYRSKVRRTP